MDSDKILAGHVALITGSNRNIGRSIALEMATAGASVVVNGHRDRAAIDEVVTAVHDGGGQAIGCLADVSDRKAIQGMVGEAERAFGKVDIAISNVSIRGPTPFLEITDEHWELVLRSNLSASFYLAQATLPFMIAQKWGRIIHISGGANFFTYAPNRAASIAAKSGMHGLTKALAREFGPQGVTANTIAPSNVDTTRDWSKYLQGQDEIATEVPLRRRADPKEIAATCVFLASPGGGYISGQAIHVNGGYKMF